MNVLMISPGHRRLENLTDYDYQMICICHDEHGDPRDVMRELLPLHLSKIAALGFSYKGYELLSVRLITLTSWLSDFNPCSVIQKLAHPDAIDETFDSHLVNDPEEKYWLRVIAVTIPFLASVQSHHIPGYSTYLEKNPSPYSGNRHKMV